MAVIVRAPAGVFYRHQYGGITCRQGSVQGYMVPVFSRPAFTALTGLFEVTLGGAGAPPRAWPPDPLAIIRDAVSDVAMCAPSMPISRAALCPWRWAKNAWPVPTRREYPSHRQTALRF
ncbi:MAG TPA: DUF6210 family protein [Streptosporangiaceae bacterium]|nr:DUF6210 family protein [Streptosporangiaceae bacterium]